MVSAVVILGVLLYVRGQNLNSTLANTSASTRNSSDISKFSVPFPTGDVIISIVKVSVNKYNLLLDTKGTRITSIDLRFGISDDLANVLASKGNIVELNDLFIGKTENNVLIVQAGSINGYTGKGILATLSLQEVNTQNPTLTLLPLSFINAGSDLTINELSNSLSNYRFTLQ